MAKAVKSKENKKSVVRKKVKRNVTSGSVYIQSTFNNTMITITDENGGVISWATAGSTGFKGTKKSTPYAASIAAAAAIEKAKAVGFSGGKIYVSGVGSGRESAVRAFMNANIDISLIKDITPIAHNGCRPKKPRRV
ncbi:MAG: 30S ribosomal protein S11 [Patescibacteria group bacterium]|jgi:small subunit ribosomal protein S11